MPLWLGPPMLASKGSRKDVGSVIGAGTIPCWGSEPLTCCQGAGVPEEGQAAFQTHTSLLAGFPLLTEALFAGWLGPPGRCAPGPGWAEASAVTLAQRSEINMVIFSGAGLEAGAQPLGSASHFRRVGLCLEFERRHSDDAAGFELQWHTDFLKIFPSDPGIAFP